MFRAAPRLIARSALRTAPLRSFAPPARRYLSTAPPTQKRRSFKSLVARVGVAGAIIYYYNTVDLFAEEGSYPVQALPETEIESEHLPTIESIAEERKRRQAVQAQLEAQKQKEQQQHAKPSDGGGEGGMEGLEEEAGQQGAFNPETGEINWDCPCLGGMADGPCGEQFKKAFSCFVYSEEEPKGMDCIDRFKDMQNCFREYPEVYGSEMDEDAEEEEGDDVSAPAQPQIDREQPTRDSPTDTPAPETNAQSQPSSTPRSNDAAKFTSKPSPSPSSSRNPIYDARDDMSSTQSSSQKDKPQGGTDTQRAEQAKRQVKKQEPVSESERLVPKGSHDEGEKGTGVRGGR